VRDEIWTKTDDSYSFKKSHAVAYAHAIVVQMNQICESISYEFS
jgi:DNA polymerase III alpha subunit